MGSLRTGGLPSGTGGSRPRKWDPLAPLLRFQPWTNLILSDLCGFTSGLWMHSLYLICLCNKVVQGKKHRTAVGLVKLDSGGSFFTSVQMASQSLLMALGFCLSLPSLMLTFDKHGCRIFVVNVIQLLLPGSFLKDAYSHE